MGIRLRAGALVGGMGLHRDPAHNRAELGYWLGLPHWGNGYATEAAKAAVRHGFEQIKLNRIFAGHFGHNPASGNVCARLA